MTARRGAGPGLLAGTAFLLVEAAAGATPWAFPEGIAHTLGVGTPGYALQPWPLLLGVVMHLLVSAGLGVLYAAIARRLRLSGARLVIGAVAFSMVETAVAIWAVLHTILPATLPALLDAVPWWASVAGHTGYGLLLGLALLHRSSSSS